MPALSFNFHFKIRDGKYHTQWKSSLPGDIVGMEVLNAPSASSLDVLIRRLSNKVEDENEDEDKFLWRPSQPSMAYGERTR